MGATASDIGVGIALDGAGGVYTTGFFQGTGDFDPTSKQYALTSAGSSDIFVAKLTQPGALLAQVSTAANAVGAASLNLRDPQRLPDREVTQGATAEVDSGSLRDLPYPIAAPSGTFPIAAEVRRLTELNAAGSALLYPTFLGDSGIDRGSAIPLDGVGYAYLTGSTAPFDFPTTANAFQLKNGGTKNKPNDAFVTKVSLN